MDSSRKGLFISGNDPYNMFPSSFHLEHVDIKDEAMDVGLPLTCPPDSHQSMGQASCSPMATDSSSDSTLGLGHPHMNQDFNPQSCSSTADAMMVYEEHDLKGKRRCSKTKEQKTCGVCGDRALGFNFDAITCESCKAFFRRNATKGVETFKCSNNEDCRLDSSNRRFCKRCRLKKCFDIGMKKDYILTDNEKAEKRRKIYQNKVVRRLEELGWLPRDLIPSELTKRELLTEEEIAEIQEIEVAYALSLQVHVDSREGSRHNPSMGDLVNLAEISIRRVIAMSKKIGVFKALPQVDQVALLKSGSLELLILRGVITYNPEKEQFLESADDEEIDAVSAEDVMLGAGGQAGIAFLRFARSLHLDLHCSRVEMILLLIICLFSVDRSPISDESKELVDAAQVKYTLLLEKLLRTRYPVPEARRLFPLLMKKLCDLRELNECFAKELESVSSSSVLPLMSELFDFRSQDTVESEEASKDS